MTFWSQTPYKLGEGAVKYVVTPSASPERPTIAAWQFTRLPARCADRAVDASARFRRAFDLSVNPQTDAAAMPIEDPTVEWTSAPVRLATISIYPQKCDAPEQMAFVDNLSWTSVERAARAPAARRHQPRTPVRLRRQRRLRHKTTGVVADRRRPAANRFNLR